MRAAWFLVAVAACDSGPPPKVTPVPEPPTPTPISRVTTSVELQWSNILMTDGCFFFSGPDGRDDRLQGAATLERNGATLSLEVGNARFDGAYRGGKLDLLRVSKHDFDGQWLAFETITGEYTEQIMRAKYRYSECQKNETCPGRCVIAAELVLAR